MGAQIIPASQELEGRFSQLELVLGVISQAASAATRVHQRQILTTPTPAIEFEDDFLYLVAQVSGTTRTKFSSSFAQRCTVFRGLAGKKWRLRRSRFFFREQAIRPIIDNEFWARHVHARSRPASRRDAQKIGRRFSAGSLRYVIGPVPEGRGQQTGQR